jgi:hypothetical protein
MKRWRGPFQANRMRQLSSIREKVDDAVIIRPPRQQLYVLLIGGVLIAAVAIWGASSQPLTLVAAAPYLVTWLLAIIVLHCCNVAIDGELLTYNGFCRPRVVVRRADVARAELHYLPFQYENLEPCLTEIWIDCIDGTSVKLKVASFVNRDAQKIAAFLGVSTIDGARSDLAIADIRKRRCFLPTCYLSMK